MPTEENRTNYIYFLFTLRHLTRGSFMVGYGYSKYKIMNTETKTATTEGKNAIAMSSEVLASSQDINGVLTQSHEVRAVYHTHFVDMQSGLCGIEDLITDILSQHNAIFPVGIENTPLRNIAIAGGMFTCEVFNCVESRFTAGSIRYPLKTITLYLSQFMKGKVGRIQLTGKEDINRPCNRPRCKWYLIDSPVLPS